MTMAQIQEQSFIKHYNKNPQILEEKYGLEKEAVRVDVRKYVDKAASQLRKDLINQCAEAINQELFEWKKFDFKLPPSNFFAKGGKSDDTDSQGLFTGEEFFKPPRSIQELVNLATDENGRRKKLNETQLAEIRETGRFRVNSEVFPGKAHVWQLSTFLATGKHKLRESLRWTIGTFVEAFRYDIPEYLLSNDYNRKLSAIRVIKQIPNICLDTASILIGIPENKLSQPLHALLEEHRNEYLFEEFKDELIKLHKEKKKIVKKNYELGSRYAPEVQRLAPERFILKAEIDGSERVLDTRIWDADLSSELTEQFYSIMNNISDKWHREKIIFIKKLIKEELGEGREITSENKEEVLNEIEKKIVKICKKRIKDEVFQKIMESKELKVKGGEHIGELIIALAMLNKILEKVDYEIDEEQTVLRQKFTTELQENHPVMKYVIPWMNDRIRDKFIETINKNQPNKNAWEKDIEKYYNLKKYENALREIQNKLAKLMDQHTEFHTKLHNYIEQFQYLIQRDYVWQTTLNTDQLKKQLVANHQEPSRVYSWRSYIVLNKNKKVTYNEKLKHYELENYQYYTVKSSEWFWRWRIVYKRSIVWYKNNTHRLIHSLLYGPSSYKALVYKDPYPWLWHFNSKTGEYKLHPTTKHATIYSTFHTLMRDIKDCIAAFERQPDHGIIGKGITRIFHRFWNIVAKGFFGGTIVLTVFPIAIILSLIVQVILLVTNIIWSPLSSIYKYLHNIFIYDTERAGNYGIRYSGLLSILFNRIFIQFLSYGVFTVLIGFIMKPAFYTLLFFIQLALVHARKLYDLLAFHLIVRRKARIPIENSFLARAVSGPGLSAEYFYQVLPEHALTVVQFHLEQDELRFFQLATQARIRLPQYLATQFMNQIFAPFLNTKQYQLHNALLSKFAFQKKEQELNDSIRERGRQVLGNQFYNFKDRVKMTPEQLSSLTIQSERLVREYVSNNIFNAIFDNSPELIKQFWSEKNILEYFFFSN